MQPLLWKGQRLGTVLRTKRRSNPLWISVGHRVSLDTAVDWVKRCDTGYRLPEPTRQAHLAANAVAAGAWRAVPDLLGLAKDEVGG